MGCYTISECVIEKLDEGKKYTADLLITFAQDNEHKIAIDNNGRIKEIYTKAAESHKDTNIKTGILFWLYLMTQQTPKWEQIEINDTQSDVFLEVCSTTIDKTLIVSSENNCKWTKGITREKNYLHNGAILRIINKDEAIKEIKPATILIDRSIIASKSSTIKNIKYDNK